MSKYFLSLIGTLIFSTTLLQADASLGEQLETQMWEDMKHQNFTAVEANIAKNFQSVHTFGALTREAEISLIKNLYLGSYEISDFQVTENGDTLVVTYTVSVTEKIENQVLSAKPAPRMSVWQKINGHWKWIAHANLKEIPIQKPHATTPPVLTPKKIEPAKLIK
ncbi:MAG: nuclear transport factor 2 family protein [Parachlamydiaceae bacterium]